MLFTAFQYIAGELDARAVADFEIRLEHDESAQHALIEAVRVTQASLEAFETSPEPRQLTLAQNIDDSASSFGQVKTYITIIASLATVILVCFSSWWIYQLNDSNPTGVDIKAQNEKVANVWVTTLTEPGGNVDEGFDFFDDSQSEEESWLVNAYMEGGGSFSAFSTENSMFNN